MLKLLVLLAVLACVAAQLNPEYDTFLKKHKKKRPHLTAKDIKRREGNFLANKDLFAKHNKRKRVTYQVGVNEHTDRDLARFMKERCRLKLPTDVRALPAIYDASTPAKESVNWTSYGQPVTNQGVCGSCWSFATVATVEFNQAIRKLPITELSEQHLVDCDTSNKGCDGGWPRDALNFIKNNLGNKVAKDSDYAYTSGPTNLPGTCRTAGFNTVSLDIGEVYQENLNGNEARLMARVSNDGPVAIGMWAPDGVGFFGYKSGIFFDPTCPVSNSTFNQCSQVNHAMVVVGYGKDESGTEFWIVRNSWGSTWGENGYIRMAKNRGNNCNVACFAMGIV